MTARAQRILGYRERQVFELVQADLAAMGRVRTYDEIAAALGMHGRHGVRNVMLRLERRSLLRRVGSGDAWRIELRPRELSPASSLG